MQTPSIIGRYQLVAEIGRGGMGDVYLAVAAGPAGFEKLIVLKTLQQAHAQDPGFVDMFMDEARLAARLSHPHIVQTNEVDHQEGIYYMAMEFLDGQPLQRLRTAKGRPAGTATVELAALSQALLGLHHAHELRALDGSPLGVVHRDASPHNIFLTYDGFAKVVDFGIAKAMNSSHQTVTGTLKGKIRYMAPEQSMGAPVDRRSDVFAIGVAAWEAVARQRMWPSEQPEVYVLHELSNGRIPQLSALNISAPPALLAACQRACAPHPQDRFSSALAFHEALEQAVAPYPEWSASPKKIAQYMEATFGEERRRFREKVDQQLAMMRSMRTGEVRAALLAPSDLGRSTMTPSSHLTASRRAPGSVTASALSVSRPPQVDGHYASITNSHAAYSQPNYSLSGQPQVPPAVSAPPAKSSAALFAVLAIGVLGIGGIGAFMAIRSGSLGGGIHAPADTATGTSAGATPTVTIAATSAAALPAKVAEPDTLVLEVGATPPSATLTLDGKLLPGNPLTKTFPKDGKTHRLVVSAAGYTSRELELTFDGNAKFDVALSRGHGQVRVEAPPPRHDTVPKTDPSSGATPTGPVPAQDPSIRRPIRTVDTAYPG